MNIGQQRLAQQHIASGASEDPAAVAQWMGAVQAQDYQQAMWAIGTRTRNATLAEVEQAIREARIIWTWLLRGTLHVASAENVKGMLELIGPRLLAASRSRRQQLGLDDPQLERSRALVSGALSGGKCLTRSALMRLLEEAGISPAGQRGYHILWYLGMSGVICLGPMQAKEQTFTLLGEWAPHTHQPSRDTVLAELAAAYFASHGPATLSDFAHWAGLTQADARAGLDAAKPRLVVFSQDGKDYWLAANAAEYPAHDLPSVYLLPGFDEYLLGYRERGAVLAAEHANKIVPGGNGIFLPMLVVDGQIVGTWKRAFKKAGAEITVTPFLPLAVSYERIALAAQRFSDFFNTPLARLTLTAPPSPDAG